MPSKLHEEFVTDAGGYKTNLLLYFSKSDSIIPLPVGCGVARNGRRKRRKGSCCQVASLSTGYQPASSPTLRWEHPRSAHTGASRGLRLGTQDRASGNGTSFCVHLLGLGRHGWESGAQTSSLWCLTVVQNFLTLTTYAVAPFFTTRRKF